MLVSTTIREYGVGFLFVTLLVGTFMLGSSSVESLLAVIIFPFDFWV